MIETRPPAVATTTDRPLPPGWRWARLGKVCERIDYGYTASADFSIREPRFLRITDIKGGGVDWDAVPGCRIDAAEEAKNSLADGDIVIARTGSVGNSLLIERPPRVVFASYLIRLRFNTSVCPEYVYAFFHSQDYWSQIAAAARGGIQSNVNATLLANLQLPLPPLPEQRRIAAILREQLAAVDRARAAAQAQLDAAKALPAAYLRAVFESDEARAWPMVKLGELLRLRKEVVHPRDKPYGPAVFVGLEHIESHTGRRIGSLDVEMSELTGRKPRFHEGDIVYGYLRPYLNKVWVAEFDGLCSVDQYVYPVSEQTANGDFVAWFMRSPTYLDRAPIDITPGQLPRIRTEEVATVEINLPDLESQNRIVAHLEDSLGQSHAVRTSIENQLDAINQLPAALLRRAFNGDL